MKIFEIESSNEEPTLRDWFAGLAMQGMLANEQTKPDSILICKAAYQLADEMMQAKEKK